MKRFRWGYLLCFATLVATAMPVSAATAFEQGVSSYKMGRYKHAVVFLSQAASLDPTNALCHYYLANTLTKLNQPAEAALEYQICKRLEPEGPVARYCHQAIEVLKGHSGGVSSIASSAGATEHNIGAGHSGHHGGLHSTNPAVNRAMFVIKREADYEKTKHKFQGEVRAKAMISLADADAQKIKEHADAEVQKVYTDSWVSLPTPTGRILINPYLYNPSLARLRTDEIRKEAEEQEKRVRRLAEARAAEYKSWSEDRQKALDEVVVNLKSQMEQPVGRSGVKLQPIGTDLYVRYYGHHGKVAKNSRGQAGGSDPSLELRAKQTTGTFEANHGVKPDMQIIKTVSGKVIR